MRKIAVGTGVAILLILALTTQRNNEPELHTAALAGPDWKEPGGPSVASDGSSYLVVWEEEQQNKGPKKHLVQSMLVDAGGNASAPVVVAEVSRAPARPRVAFAHGSYLVTWQDEQKQKPIPIPTMQVFGALIEADGSVGQRLSFTSGTGDKRLPDVSKSASGHLVVWNADTLFPFSPKVYGGQLGPTGRFETVFAWQENFGKPGVRVAADPDRGASACIIWREYRVVAPGDPTGLLLTEEEHRNWSPLPWGQSLDEPPVCVGASDGFVLAQLEGRLLAPSIRLIEIDASGHATGREGLVEAGGGRTQPSPRLRWDQSSPRLGPHWPREGGRSPELESRVGGDHRLVRLFPFPARGRDAGRRWLRGRQGDPRLAGRTYFQRPAGDPL